MLDFPAELIRDVRRERQAKQAGDAERLALLLWAGLHGVVSLQINKPTISSPRGGRTDRADDTRNGGMP